MNFFTKYQKILFIVGFLLVAGLIGFLLYNFFFRQVLPTPGPKKIEKATTTTDTRLPGAGEGGPQAPAEEAAGAIPTTTPSAKADGGLTVTTELSKEPVLKPTLSGNGQDLQYYNKNDGKFYRIDENGNAALMTDKVFHNVQNVVWSPKKSKAILEYPDGANIVYDFATGKQVTLPQHWEDFEFSPSGEQIVMKSIGLDKENRWLAIANDDGSGQKPLEFIGENADRVYPSWQPNNQSVAMFTRGLDLDRQEVFFIGRNEENFKSTIVEGRGFQPKWSESGDKLLYSVYSTSNNLKPKLWIVNAEGENIGAARADLEIETWASKCVFANSTDLYCGVPESLETGAGLFPEMARHTRDNLYKINTETGLKELVAIPEGSFNMSDLTVSKDGKNLYFTDSNSATIQKIEL